MNKITENKKQRAKSNGSIGITLFVLMLLVAMFLGHSTQAQTNVTLYSVSPTSAKVGDTVIITGSNLLQCAPVDGTTRCNVQFHDINLRRSTVSGTESATQIQAVVADGLCPGTTTIKVGELTSFSNAIPFTILDQGAVPAGCRVITSITPQSGMWGTSVNIYGRNLHGNVQLYDSSYGKTDVTGVMIGGTNQVNFTIPSGLTPGTYSVRVGPNVSDVSNGLPFRVIGDTTAPFITNIKINNITTSGATVLWDTSEPADGQIEFCLTNNRCSTNSPLISGLTTSHVVNLSNLAADTRYYIWIKSKDGAGNLSTAGPMTFKTLANPTPTPTPGPAAPVISNVQVTSITNYSVTVTWNTDKPATSAIVACTNSFYCSGGWATNTDLTTNHSLSINNLHPDTEYYIWIISKDATGNKGYFTTSKFRTQVGLAISNLSASATQTSIRVDWTTNYPSNSLLIVCKFSFYCYGATVVSDPANILSHSLSATGLSAGTRYYYYVISKDPQGYRIYTSNSVSTLP